MGLTSIGARKPWQHQVEAIAAATDKYQVGLLFDPGCGKTYTSIQIMRRWFAKENKGRILRTIVFAPPIVLENWSREIKEHSLMGQYVQVLYGTGKNRMETLVRNRPHAKIYITNYESLTMPGVFEALVAYDPEVIIFDEAHKLKNHQAKRTKLAVRLSERAQYRQILTGTPILNSIMDLFSQFLALDGGATFGKTFWKFRAEYFYDANAGMPKDKHFPDWRVRPSAEKIVSEKVKALCTVARKEECMDLPPLIREEIRVDLSREQRKHYDNLKNDYITYVQDKACVASLAITKLLRMLQLISGHLVLTDDTSKEVLKIKDNPRVEALHELLETITPHAKVLVWSVFEADYDAIRSVCEKLKVGYVECHGKVSPTLKQGAVDAFQTDENVRVFFGHPLSGGIGANLTAAAYSIFYSKNFSREQYIQARARNYRGGSEVHEKITEYHIIARDTLDEGLLPALDGKEELSDRVIMGLVK